MRPGAAATLPTDTGRKAYREPHEFPDGRLAIQYGPFWADASEEATYVHAVESNPRREDEGCMTYVARIATIVAGRYAKAKTMPQGRLSKKAYQRRIEELEGQR